MLTTAQQLQHLPCMGFVARLSQHLSETFGHRIAAQDGPAFHAPCNIGRLLVRQAGHELRRRFATTDSTFRVVARRESPENRIPPLPTTAAVGETGWLRSSGPCFNMRQLTTMIHPPFQILLEDNHLLAVAKPAELPTMGVESAAAEPADDGPGVPQGQVSESRATSIWESSAASMRR